MLGGGNYERMKTRNAELTMPPTEVIAFKIAMLKDGCGLAAIDSRVRKVVWRGNAQLAASGGAKIVR